MAKTVLEELVVELGFDLKNTAGIEKFKSNLKGLASEADALAKKIGNVATVMGTAFAGGLGFLGKSVIQTGAMFESLDVQLQGLMGSSEKAKEAMSWIRDFAQQTPLSLGETARAFAMLKNYGIDPMSGALQAAVDMNAKMGGSVDTLMRMVMPMGQAWALGKLQTQDIKQMVEVGVPVYELLERVTGQTGDALQDLIKKGKLGKKEMTAFFEEMGRSAAGSSAMMSKTFDGILGRLGDEREGFLKRIADAGSFDAAKEGVEGFLSLLKQWGEDKTLDRIAGQVSRNLTKIIKAFSYMVNRMARNIDSLSKNWHKLKGPITTIGIALAALAVYARPIIVIFTTLGLLIEDFLVYLDDGQSVIGDFIEEFKRLTGLGDLAGQWAAGIGVTLLAGFMFGFKGILAYLGGAALSLLTAAAPKVALALLGPAGWAAVVAAFGTWLISRFLETDLGHVALEWGNQLFNGIWSKLKDLGSYLKGLLPWGDSEVKATISTPKDDIFRRIDSIQGYTPQQAANMQSTANVNTNVTVNVQGGMDPAKGTQVGNNIGAGVANNIPAARMQVGGV